MKRGTIDLTKFKRLQRRLGETIRGTVGLLELIWYRAARDCPRGDIGRLSNLEIALMADYEGDADELVLAMVECGWFDTSLEHRLVIHDWHEHAPNWLRGVVARRGGFVTISSEHIVRDHESPTDGCELSQPSLPQSSPVQSPPPTPAPSQSEPELEPLGPSWEVVAAAMANEGVRKPEKACLEARARECLPNEAMAAIEYWRSNRPAWDAGALYYKIFGLRPEEKASARWPKKSPEFERLKSAHAAVQKSAQAIRTRVESRSNAESSKLERQELEQHFGEELNSMDRKAIRKLIARTWPENTEFYFSQLPPKGPPIGTLRESLLLELKAVAKRPAIVGEVQL